MPIKFSCPNCKKPLSVKDHLAGKKANCPACKKPLTIPGSAKETVLQPEPHIEELAAAALMDAPAAPPPKIEDTRTVDFNCPQCDEPLKMPVDLQGKQSPCPQCKRIIKVPLLVKRDPTDWRKTDPRVPSAARRDAEPAPEGAWGSTTMSAVSRQAMLEVAPPRREPWTLRQKLTRGGWLLTGVLVAGLGAWIGMDYWNQRKEKQAYNKAEELLKAEEARERKSALLIAAGEYRLRANKDDGAKHAREYFQQARKFIGELPDGLERETLLTELAVAQVDLGGDAQEAVRGEKLKWEDAAQDVRQTLQALRALESRAEALARVSRKLIEKKQEEKVGPLATLLGSPSNPLRADGTQDHITPQDAAALLAVVGLELYRGGNTKSAEDKAVRAVAFFQPVAGQTRPPLPASLVALCKVLGIEPPKPGAEVDDSLNASIGEAQGEVLKGYVGPARDIAAKIQEPEPRWRVLVGIAAAARDKPDPETLGEAISLVEPSQGPLAGHALPPWVMLRMIELSAAAGIDGDRIKTVADSLGDPQLANCAQLAILRGKLERTKDKAEVSWADALNKGSAAHGIALLEIARHNAKRGLLTLQDVQGWDEEAKAFGYMGLALGRQDLE